MADDISFRCPVCGMDSKDPEHVAEWCVVVAMNSPPPKRPTLKLVKDA